MPEHDDTQTQAHPLTPERFARIRAVFKAALERKPSAREGYIDGACGTDDLLRKEVLRSSPPKPNPTGSSMRHPLIPHPPPQKRAASPPEPPSQADIASSACWAAEAWAKSTKPTTSSSTKPSL